MLRGHGNSVGSAEFSPDGTRVVTSSFDQTARVWDAALHEPLATIGRQGFPVGSESLSPTEALSWWRRRRMALRAFSTPRPATVITLAVDDDDQGRPRRFSAPTVATSSPGDASRRRFEPGIRPTARLRGARGLPKGAPIVAVPSPDATHIPLPQLSSARPILPTTAVALWDRTGKQPVRDVAPRRPRRGSRFSTRAGRRFLAWNEQGSRGCLGHRHGPQACHVLEPRPAGGCTQP